MANKNKNNILSVPRSVTDHLISNILLGYPGADTIEEEAKKMVTVIAVVLAVMEVARIGL